MKHEELRNHIWGSHLMRHNLEAFLIQSAYLEGLLKDITDYHFFSLIFSLTQGKFSTVGDNLYGAIKHIIEKYTFAELSDFLKREDKISNEEQTKLNEYRQKRNKILHDLLKQSASPTFDNELIDAYNLGKTILDSNEFKYMDSMLDKIEKIREDKKRTLDNNKTALLPSEKNQLNSKTDPQTN